MIGGSRHPYRGAGRQIPVRDKKTELNIVNLITTVAERGAPPLKSTDIRFTKNQLQARTNLEALVS
jgi:hypothetical protein